MRPKRRRAARRRYWIILGIGCAAVGCTTHPAPVATRGVIHGSTRPVPQSGASAATQPCAEPENGQRLVSVTKVEARRSGVWLALPGHYSVRMPVLVGSNDHGASWIYHCLHNDIGDADSVFFVDETHGWAAVHEGGGRLLATTDGGTTWTAGHTPPANDELHDVFFTDRRHGWAVGETLDTMLQGTGSVLRSTDGGATWTAATGPPGIDNLHAVWSTDPKHVWVISHDPQVAATTDGGRTWTVQRLETIGYLWDVAFADSRHGWIVSNDNHTTGQVLATRDAGRTWTEIARFPHSAESIRVLDADHIVVGGQYPATLESSADGGATWTARPLPESFAATSVYDPSTFWAFAQGEGRAGCLYSTTDAGRTWTPHALFNTASCPPATDSQAH
ncbi:MAG: hypothetical protein QOJ23_5998 [Actinomycetota bacterium]|nr:hypothetical protein [Actinomycetota bacterium]